VLLFDPVTGRLQHGAAPSLPDAYNAAADGLEIGAAVGSCGTAAYEKRAVIVEDIRTHPYWENYREIAEAHQLRACWSQPLLGRDGSVLGTLALYRSEPHIPSSHEQDVVRMTAHIAEIAIRRSRDIARQREAEAALQVANNALEQRVLERTAELETARKSIEEERNLLRTVIDAVPDFIYVKDLEYRIILSNAAHTRSLIAQNPDFAPGMTDSEIFPEPLLHHFLRDDEIVLREGKPVFKREELSIGEDGEVIWALTTKLPLRNLEGTITGLVGVTQDITDIKANEEALSQKYKEELRMQEFFRALSQRLELATQAGQIGIWDWDLRTGVIQWDARIYALYGLVIGEDEASTELWQRLVHPDDLEPAATALNAALIEGKPFELEFRVIRRDGSMRYVKSSGIVLWDTDGSAARMIGVNQDITDLRQALEKEKELSELKSRFVSMASHEFRTPLATILSTTDNLIRYRDRMTAEQVEERLNTTREQALHMREMMEDMLQLTRIQSGRVEIKPVMQDLDAFCRAIISGFELQADRTISIQYHTSAVPLMAEVDTKLFRQLVTNLIGNALKYSPDSKPIHVSLSSDTEWFTLSVRDEGIGIAEDDQKHLFVPFHRGINVGTISGTGLGLSIAKQVVEAHGGTIGVESQVGKGSIFTVRFPVRAQAAAAPIPDEAR
jgi:PAS domain S-box-containing protein